jgi:hypothetical protein
MMQTRKQAAQTVDYWAGQNEETVEEILATLEFLDDESRDMAFEQLAYLIDDANFLRKHAQDLRTNPGYNTF